ncbi:hypothetical protein ACEUAV_15675, partial [Aeromonas veronii]
EVDDGDQITKFSISSIQTASIWATTPISSISTAIGSFIDYFQPLLWALFWPPLLDAFYIK